MLASCGSIESESSSSTVKSSSSTANEDGREVYAIKIGNLEVMTEDLGQMNWENAKKSCAALGDEWRLPTKDELNILYQNMDKIGASAYKTYWSSAEDDINFAWAQSFTNGGQPSYSKNHTVFVRAVRGFYFTL